MKTTKELIKAIGNKNANYIPDSEFYGQRTLIKTSIPIVNIALSGSINGGLSSGLTVIAGASKSYKTVLSLTCAKAYLDLYPESVLFFFDAEYGASLSYFNSVGIDINRVVHIPVTSVEEFKIQSFALLNTLERGYKCFMLLDSLGALASEKTILDTTESKNTTDLTRPKAINLVARLITPLLNSKDIPCIFINHLYDSMDKYTPQKMGGGNGILYASNTVLYISKTKIKDGSELEGYTFNIKIEKSRYIKEGMGLSFDVLYDDGVQPLSGVAELAIEYGVLTQGGGWYTQKDPTTGEVIGEKMRASAPRFTKILEDLLLDQSFDNFVQKKFKLVFD
jgi:RecA/RadA recombinase